MQVRPLYNFLLHPNVHPGENSGEIEHSIPAKLYTYQV